MAAKFREEVLFNRRRQYTCSPKHRTTVSPRQIPKKCSKLRLDELKVVLKEEENRNTRRKTLESG